MDDRAQTLAFLAKREAARKEVEKALEEGALSDTELRLLREQGWDFVGTTGRAETRRRRSR